MWADEAYRLRDEVVFLDVREPFEWSAGAIDGALHIPLAQLPARADQLDRAARYIAVCRSGSRSGQATRFLRRQGLRVENLDGGMQAWVMARLPVASSDGRPGRVV